MTITVATAAATSSSSIVPFGSVTAVAGVTWPPDPTTLMSSDAPLTGAPAASVTVTVNDAAAVGAISSGSPWTARNSWIGGVTSTEAPEEPEYPKEVTTAWMRSGVSAETFGRSSASSAPPDPFVTRGVTREVPPNESPTNSDAPGTGAPDVSSTTTSTKNGVVPTAEGADSVRSTRTGTRPPVQRLVLSASAAREVPVSSSPGARVGCWRRPSIPHGLPPAPVNEVHEEVGRYQAPPSRTAKARGMFRNGGTGDVVA